MRLHIVIHSDQRIAVSIIQPGHHRIVLAGIFSKLYDFYARVIIGEGFQLLNGSSAVRGKIVHQHEFIGGSFLTLQFLNRKFYNFADSLCGIVAGYND